MVKIKPLEFVYGKAETIVGTFRVESYWKDKIGGTRAWRWAGPEMDESDAFYMYSYGKPAKSEQAAIDAAQACYDAMIYSALDL